jgi:hypothetical protein
LLSILLESGKDVSISVHAIPFGYVETDLLFPCSVDFHTNKHEKLLIGPGAMQPMLLLQLKYLVCNKRLMLQIQKLSFYPNLASGTSYVNYGLINMASRGLSNLTLRVGFDLQGAGHLKLDIRLLELQHFMYIYKPIQRNLV